MLWTPIYAKADPELFGFPFFYWYQFVWVPLSVAITWFVYTRTRTRGAPPGGRLGGGRRGRAQRPGDGRQLRRGRQHLHQGLQDDLCRALAGHRLRGCDRRLDHEVG